MKKIILLICLVAVLFSLSLVACSSKVEKFGQPIENRTLTKIRDILAAPENYDAKTVTVKGKIAVECPTGCWLNLQDGNALIYIDFHASGFALPQKVGKEAIIEGNVKVTKKKVMLIGKGVEIK